MYEINHFSTVAEMQTNFKNLSIKMAWSVVSKAADKSDKTMIVCQMHAKQWCES